MKKELNWAVIGTGVIANEMAQAMQKMDKKLYGYIEIMEYPRADKAFIVDAAAGDRREICAGQAANALYYEMKDMEDAILSGDDSIMRLAQSKDVMDIMTKVRKDWNLKYPGEVW